LKRLRFALFAVAGLLVAGLAVPALSSPNSVGGGPIAQDILGSGSDTTMRMMAYLDGLYTLSPGCDTQGTIKPSDFSCVLPDPTGTITTENYAHDQAHEAYFVGSGKGISQLCNQGQLNVAHVDFARSSRVPGSSDCTGLHFVAYAQDGITVESFPTFGTAGTNPTAPANFNNTSGACAGHSGTFCLTKAQMIGIWVTCTITNWNQVGSTVNAPISIYTASSSSGTRQTFDSYLGGSSSTCVGGDSAPRAIIGENQNQSIINGTATGGVDDRRTALYYFSNGVYQTNVTPHPDTSKLGLIDGITTNSTTISNGTAPITRSLFNVFCTASCAAGASSQATVNYVGEAGWICKPSTSHSVDPLTGANYHSEINSVIQKQNFVPFPLGPTGGGAVGQSYCRLTVH
jgi:ABC-type phosphate transport system substrate-binding protein